MDISTLGPAGAAVAIVWLFLRFMREAFSKLTVAVDKNTASNDQLHKFMVALNGSLKKVVKEKKK